MKRRFTIIGVFCSAIILSGVWLVSRSFEVMDKCTQIAYEPNIIPDYSNIVIPHNIAPLNFRIFEKGQTYRVKIHSNRGAAIGIVSKTGLIHIPLRK